MHGTKKKSSDLEDSTVSDAVSTGDKCGIMGEDNRPSKKFWISTATLKWLPTTATYIITCFITVLMTITCNIGFSSNDADTDAGINDIIVWGRILPWHILIMI